MRKSEYAQQQVENWLTRAAGPVKLDELVARVWEFTDDGDPRWISVALMYLVQDGKVRYPRCDHNHNHGDACTVEWIR